MADDLAYGLNALRQRVETARALAALRESEARYRALFDGAAEGILVAEIDTRRFVFANPAICRMLDYTEEELIGLSVVDIHPKESGRTSDF